MHAPLLRSSTTDDFSPAPDDATELFVPLRARDFLQRTGLCRLLPMRHPPDDPRVLRAQIFDALRADPVRLLIERRAITLHDWIEALFTESHPTTRYCMLADGSRAVVHGRLGRGGFGAVWDGESDRYGRIALKIPHLSAGDEAHGQIWAEVSLLSALDLPGVPRVHGTGKTADGRPFFAMDQIEGHRISCAASGDGGNSLRTLVTAWHSIARTLAELHARRIVHGDVKPDNILLGQGAGMEEAARTWLIDFGLARRLGEERIDGTTAGSRGYLDPRRLSGAPSDTAADIFALGATIFEGYAGEPLRTAKDWRRLTETTGNTPAERVTAERFRLFTQIPRRSPALEALIRSMLGNAEMRPEAEDVAGCLGEIGSH